MRIGGMVSVNLDNIGLRINGERFATCKSDALLGTRCRVGAPIAAKHALKECGGLNGLACTRESM